MEGYGRLRERFILVFLLCLAVFPCCAEGKDNIVILATTTSISDSGLLDALVCPFQEKTGITVKTVAVGTGQALKMGRCGEIDIICTHAPIAEKQFMDEGYGIKRNAFVYNAFVILGPKDDPANIQTAENAKEAFKEITNSHSVFVSRGDNSGTHNKELAIWKDAGVTPFKNSYIEAGQGMAQTITIANEKKGYVLSDKATYLALKKTVDLVILFEGREELTNCYSLLLVNPGRFPKVNAIEAEALFNFLLSNESREIIENFGKEKFGEQLFFWDAG